MHDCGAKAAAIDEEIRRNGLAILELQRRNLPVRIELHLNNGACDMIYIEFARRVPAQVSADQIGIEMIAIAKVEGEIFIGDWGQFQLGQLARKEKPIGMGPHVTPRAARAGVKIEMRRGVVIKFGLERVEIAFKARFVRPSVEGNPRLVRRVAGGHPFGFGDAQRFKKSTQLRCGTFAHPDYSDFRRFNNGDAVLRPTFAQQARGHPTGCAATHDANVQSFGRVHFVRESRKSSGMSTLSRHAASL